MSYGETLERRMAERQVTRQTVSRISRKRISLSKVAMVTQVELPVPNNNYKISEPFLKKIPKLIKHRMSKEQKVALICFHKIELK